MALDHDTQVTAPSLPPPALLEALPDAVVVADAAGSVVYANRAITTLLGHQPGDLTGQSLIVLMPERFRGAHAAGLARFLATGRGELIGGTTQVPALHASGQEMAIDLTLSPLVGDDHGGVVVGVLRDASTTVLLERQLQVSHYLSAILRVTEALAQAPDAEVAFRSLLPTLCSRLDWDAASLWQPTGDGHRLVYARTWTAPGRPAAGVHAALPPRVLRGPAAAADHRPRHRRRPGHPRPRRGGERARRLHPEPGHCPARGAVRAVRAHLPVHRP